MVDGFSGTSVVDGEDCLRHVMGVPGALGAALVDHGSGLVVRFAGRVPSEDQQTTGAGVAGLVDATLGSAAFANLGNPGHLDDIVVTAGNGHHLVHFPGGRHDVRLVLYLWLDRPRGNLAMAQRAMRNAGEELAAP